MQEEDDDFEFQLRAEKEFARDGATSRRLPVRVDPNDGVEMVWDERQRGYVPKVDDDFLANYLASYGAEGTDEEPPKPATPPPPEDNPRPSGEEEEHKAVPPDSRGDVDGASVKTSPESSKKRKAPSEPGWFELEEEQNHHVYVSGLPPDVTMDEFSELVSKYGIIMEDDNGDPKLKLYTDSSGHPKGDGLCCYLKIESVEMAVEILNQSNVRGHTIKVEKAKFQMKGDFNPSLKKKKKKKDKFKKGKQERLLDWRERKSTTDGPKRLRHERVVVFKHLFNPNEFEENPEAINDIRDDVRSECEKFGEVKKVLIHDRHPDGVGTVAFKDFEAADTCVLRMQGRWFGGLQLAVSSWDGLQDFTVEETSGERDERLAKWEQFLVEDDGKGNDKS